MLIREYHAMRSPNTCPSSSKKGRVSHGRTTCSRASACRPPSTPTGAITSVVQLDGEEGGVFTYTTMFQEEVQLVCGHDISTHLPVRHEIRSSGGTSWGSQSLPGTCDDLLP
jgi:hypothetical protein